MLEGQSMFLFILVFNFYFLSTLVFIKLSFLWQSFSVVVAHTGDNVKCNILVVNCTSVRIRVGRRNSNFFLLYIILFSSQYKTSMPLTFCENIKEIVSCGKIHLQVALGI